MCELDKNTFVNDIIYSREQKISVNRYYHSTTSRGKREYMEMEQFHVYIDGLGHRKGEWNLDNIF